MFPQNYRVVFLTGPPLKMSLDWPPPKMPRLAPPCRGDSEYFNIFNAYGGPVWDSNVFFLNQLLTGQHLANSGEAQLKKTTLYHYY